MVLRLTLKPNERIIVNGCIIRNSDRRQLIVIENQADIVREADLLSDGDSRTPVKEVYFFVQSALVDPSLREKLVPLIQKNLGRLVPVFHDEMSTHIFEAASHVSCGDFYKALRALRPVIQYEAQLFAKIDRSAYVTAAE